MGLQVCLGVDVGTSSTKGVLVDSGGRVLRSALREHEPDRPRPGHVEMHAELWWRELCDIAAELAAPGDVDVEAIGVSGMGPCVLVTDVAGHALRPAILYGIDTRASKQVARLEKELGRQAVMERGGSVLTSQAAGPKLAWLAENEPETWSKARRLFMPASWLAFRLTGAYALDHHSASQCSPLYDRHAHGWYEPWAASLAGPIELPELHWSDKVVGVVTHSRPGLPAGVPVVLGTIDAWSEAVSAGAHNPGDLMLMYGTTMFMIATVSTPVTSASMWGTEGAFADTSSLAGGMATSGAITSWLRSLTGSAGYEVLLAEAAASGAGARGLLMLPYFAGERTPLQDPDARGIVAGLNLTHRRGDLYRAALEATALAVRHNVEVMRDAGAEIRRIVAVGGGTRGGLWPQIVSDVCGLSQELPHVTIGASYGAAFLAARSLNPVRIEEWNPSVRSFEPDATTCADYDELYGLYRDLYPATAEVSHLLARRQERVSPSSQGRGHA